MTKQLLLILLIICSYNAQLKGQNIDFIIQENDLTTKDLYLKAHSLFEENKTSKAFEILQEIMIISESKNSVLQEGIIQKVYGIFYFKMGNYDKALQWLHLSNKTLGQTTAWDHIEESLKYTHFSYEELKDFDTALEYAFKAQQISDKNPGIIHNNYCSIGYNYQRLHKIDSAEYFFNKCFAYRKKHNLQKKVLSSYDNLQYIYRITNRYQQELQLLQDKVNYCKKIKDSFALADAMWSHGSMLLKLQDSSSISTYYKALNIAMNSNNHNAELRSLLGIGDFYKINGDIKEAKQYYKLATDTGETYNLLRQGAYAHESLGEAYILLQELDSAKVELEKSLQLNDTSAYLHQRPYLLETYSKYLYEIGSYKDVITYCDEGLVITESLENFELGFELSALKAEALIKTGNSLVANSFISEIKNNPSYNSLTDFDLRFQKLLYTKYKIEGNYKAALSTLEKIQNLNEQTNKQELLEYAEKLSVIYEIDKKEQENIRLQKEKELLDSKLKQRNDFLVVVIGLLIFIALGTFLLIINRNKLIRTQKELSEKNERIEALNESKDKIFSVIGHDLKGPVGGIKEFIDVIIASQTELDKKMILDFVEELGEKSKSVYTVLENLLVWANSQRGNIKVNFQKQKISLAINESIKILEDNATKKDIQLKSQLPSDIELEYDKVIVSTVIRNLISNAIKFTPEGGEIIISAKESDKHLILSVTDNGVGLSKEKINSIFIENNYETTFGTSNEKGSGLGLKLCQEFINIHNGNISVESEIGSGSTFTIALPLKQNNV